MKANGNDGSADVMISTLAFIDELKNTPVVRHYKVAEQQFRSDPGVQKLLAALRNKLESFQRSQEEGTLQQEHINELRRTQAEFQAHPSVQNFRDAQEAVGMLFQETNAIMSKILGIDFGQTAGRAGGAC